MPTFWSVPTGEWSIQFDHDRQRISVCCNGVPHAWGGYEHLKDILDSFQRYRFASGKPNCEECGHEFYDHLEPSGLQLLKGNHFPFTSTNDCSWGGGLEGVCNCSGYKNSTLDIDKLAPEVQLSGMNNFISGVRANITAEAGEKISSFVSQIEFPFTFQGKTYTNVNQLLAAEFELLTATSHAFKLLAFVGGLILGILVGKFLLGIIL
jgi:hypothetical protein